jgi:hypothetical protein
MFYFRFIEMWKVLPSFPPSMTDFSLEMIEAYIATMGAIVSLKNKGKNIPR